MHGPWGAYLQRKKHEVSIISIIFFSDKFFESTQIMRYACASAVRRALTKMREMNLTELI